MVENYPGEIVVIVASKESRDEYLVNIYNGNFACLLVDAFPSPEIEWDEESRKWVTPKEEAHYATYPNLKEGIFKIIRQLMKLKFPDLCKRVEGLQLKY